MISGRSLLSLLSAALWVGMQCCNGHEHQSIGFCGGDDELWRGSPSTHPLIDFTHNLTRKLHHTTIDIPHISQNMIFSPFGILTAVLAMEIVTKGTILGQLEQAVNGSIRGTSWQDKMAEIVEELSDQCRFNHVIKRMTNEIVIDKKLHVEVEQEGADLLSHLFQTTIQKANFNDLENVRLQTNKRASDRVNQSADEFMKSILPRGFLRKDTNVLLSNVFFFQGFWLWQYYGRDVENHPFIVDGKEAVLVPMIRTVIRCRDGYSDALRARILFIPFSVDRHGLLVILPDELDGLIEMEKRLFALMYTPKKLLEKTYDFITAVQLPKLNISMQTEFSKILKALGVVDKSASESEPDGTSEEVGRGVRLQMFHQSAMVFDEERTKYPVDPLYWAGLDTSFSPDDFIANRPFLFYVVDLANDALPLLVGRVTDPRHEA